LSMLREIRRQQTRYKLGQTQHWTYLTRVNIAIAIHRNTFTHRTDTTHAGSTLGVMLRDKEPHITGTCTAYTQTFTPARVVVLVRLGVNRVQHIVGINVHAADTAELVPGIQMVAILIKDLDTTVTT